MDEVIILFTNPRLALCGRDEELDFFILAASLTERTGYILILQQLGIGTEIRWVPPFLRQRYVRFC